MGKIILSLEVNDNEMLKKAEEIQKAASELALMVSDFKYMLEAKESPPDDEIEQLNRKVADMEKEVRSQPLNFVIDSNEVAKAALKSMKSSHKVGGDKSEKPKEGT